MVQGVSIASIRYTIRYINLLLYTGAVALMDIREPAILFYWIFWSCEIICCDIVRRLPKELGMPTWLAVLVFLAVGILLLGYMRSLFSKIDEVTTWARAWRRSVSRL